LKCACEPALQQGDDQVSNLHVMGGNNHVRIPHVLKRAIS
jgi:hypothetical protein